MHDRLFEAALGITAPWSVTGVKFDEAAKVLTVAIDFAIGSRFAVEGMPGEHPVHDTVTKTYRHLNFFQHECLLQVRTPRVKLPDGSVQLVKPQYCSDTQRWQRLMHLVERHAATSDVEVAHLALDATRVEAAATADTAASRDFLQQRIAPSRQMLRGEWPQLAASCA